MEPILIKNLKKGDVWRWGEKFCLCMMLSDPKKIPENLFLRRKTLYEFLVWNFNDNSIETVRYVISSKAQRF